MPVAFNMSALLDRVETKCNRTGDRTIEGGIEVKAKNIQTRSDARLGTRARAHG